ncbi:MAG: AAA family ATPase [Planctomycetaceae bacterium]|nr:AAA family ATPase [Planctomycetaceae bacterium]
MYERHWQLRRPAFRSDVPSEFFFGSRSHQAALLKLRYLVEQRPGLAVITGGAGTGKSYLLEAFREQLAEPAGPIVTVLYPQLSPAELLGYVTSKLKPGDDSAVHDEPRLDFVLRQLEARLAELHQQGRRPVLMIDDAQLIDDQRVWQMLLLLLNFHQSDRAQLSIVLAGPPELLGRLKRYGALLDRLELTCVLQPLGESETAAYVRHRLQAAGATTAVFADAALATVHQLSGGLPRRINRLCDFALLVGYADNLSEITATQVEAVAEELMPVAA